MYQLLELYFQLKGRNVKDSDLYRIGMFRLLVLVWKNASRRPNTLLYTKTLPLRYWGPVRGGIFIFTELGSTGNYFRGASEQLHSIGDLGSPSQRFKSKFR